MTSNWSSTQPNPSPCDGSTTIQYDERDKQGKQERLAMIQHQERNSAGVQGVGRDGAVVGHCDGERHDGRGVADVGDGDAGRGAVVGVRVGIGGPVARAHIVVARKGIAAVAPLRVVALQLVQPVGLHERHFVASLLVVVVRLRLIDVPETEPPAGEVYVTAIQLPILEEEVLGVSHPTLVHFAPSARLSGIVPVAVVRPGRHEAPAANAGGAGVGVVQIRPPEEEMADLVGAHAKLTISRDGEVGVEQSVVSRVRPSVEHKLVRPDVVGQARALSALAGVHDHECIGIAVSVVVILGEIHHLVGEFGGISCHDSGVGGVVSKAVLAVSIEFQRMWQSEGSHDLALDVHQAVGHIFVVVAHAVGAHAEPLALVVVDVLVGVEFSVGEVNQDNRDVIDSSGFLASSSGGGQRGSGPEGAVRTEETVVVAERACLHGSTQKVLENCMVGILCDEILDLLEAVEDLLSDLRGWSHEAAILHRMWADSRLHVECLACATIRESTVCELLSLITAK